MSVATITWVGAVLAQESGGDVNPKNTMLLPVSVELSQLLDGVDYVYLECTIFTTLSEDGEELVASGEHLIVKRGLNRFGEVSQSFLNGNSFSGTVNVPLKLSSEKRTFEVWTHGDCALFVSLEGASPEFASICTTEHLSRGDIRHKGGCAWPGSSPQTSVEFKRNDIPAQN